MNPFKNKYISSSPEFQCKMICQNGSLAPISANSAISSNNSVVNFQNFQIDNYFDNNKNQRQNGGQNGQHHQNQQQHQQQNKNQNYYYSNSANLFGKNGVNKYGYSQSMIQTSKNNNNHLNVYDDQQTSSSDSDEQIKQHRPSPYDEVIQRTQKVYPVTIKDFKLLKVLGKGSFGTVLLVRKIDTGRVYAMKVIKKKKLRNKTQVQRTLTQRAILGKLIHPNIVKLHFAFQSSKKLHFCLDYCQGGELFYHLQKRRRLPGNMVKFYVANIVLALDYMHQLNIVYRDLKPENVLIGFDGYAMIADFGLSKQDIMGNHGCLSFVGTAQYLAPQILKRTGHGKAVDWWSLGAITYEMLTGLPPFYSSNRQNLFKDILCSQLRYPNFIEPAAKDFIRRLLIKDSSERLGSKGVDQVKKHPWLADIDWQAMYDKESKPPFLPEITSEEDYRHFDTAFTNQSPHSHSSNSSPATLNDPDGLLQDWKGFSYTEEKMYFDCEGGDDGDNSDDNDDDPNMEVQIKASGLEEEDEEDEDETQDQIYNQDLGEGNSKQN